MAIRYADFLGHQPKQEIFDQILETVNSMKQRGIDVIDFGVGDPAIQTPPPDSVIASLSRHAKTYSQSGYPRYRGIEAFRQSACRYMQREFGVTLDPETSIMATAGSKGAVFNFPRAFINPGDYVICPTPGYPPFHLGTKAAYGIPYYLPLLEKNHFLPDIQSIPQSVLKKTKIFWINYPNSPTGTLAPAEWYSQLLAFAREHNIIIAADEGAYIDFYYEKKPLSILQFGSTNVVAFYSLSKRNNMTSYRIGFMAGDPQIISGVMHYKSYQDNGVPQFIQQAAADILADTTFIQQQRENYRQKRECLMTALAQQNFPPSPSEATFFLWQKAPSGLDGLQLCQKFANLGIVTIPGTALTENTVSPNPGEHFIRFALMPTLEQTQTAAQRISQQSPDYFRQV